MACPKHLIGTINTWALPNLYKSTELLDNIKCETNKFSIPLLMRGL